MVTNGCHESSRLRIKLDQTLEGKSSTDQTPARAIPVPASKNNNAIEIQIN